MGNETFYSDGLNNKCIIGDTGLNLVPRASFPLTSSQKTKALGSTILKKTKEIFEFCQSGFTAQSQSGSMACYNACLKWLLPELSFSDR